MFLRSRNFPVGIRYVYKRLLSSVPKKEIYDIIETTQELKSWKSLSSNRKLAEYIGEAFALPNHENTAELLQLKRKMLRRFNDQYSIATKFIEDGLPSELDRLKFNTVFQRYVGVKQYKSFKQMLVYIKDRKELKPEAKREELYKAIELHRRCNPANTKKTGILLPDEIHQWFYNFVRRSERLNHYLFLVENWVVTSGHSVEMMQQALLKGSKMEYNVATYQYFINDPEKRETFDKKFVILHSFRSMRRLITLMITNREFAHIKDYLEALTTRLESSEMKNSNIAFDVRKLFFIDFMHTLQYFARVSNNIEMFLQILTIMMDLMPKDTPITFLRNSFVEILNYFQKKSDTDTVFKVMSLFNKYPLTRPNTRFTNEILGRLIHSLRHYKDPKLSASYILITFRSIETRVMLNDLGLWCLIFDGKFGHLSSKSIKKLKFKNKIISINVPKDLKLYEAPDSVVLNELYIVIFDYYKDKLSKEEYKELILNCYKSYCSFLKHKVQADLQWKVDTSILRTILHRVKFDLGDDKLAYEILMSFYSLNINPRFDSKCTPFGIVLYQNKSITQQEFSDVLELMHKCNAPMDHRTMITIIQRFLRSNNVEYAKEWYNRLLQSGYSLKHFTLIQAAEEHGWNIPPEAKTYLKENADNNSSEEDYFDELYMQNPAEDSYTNSLLQLANDLGAKAEESKQLQIKRNVNKNIPKKTQNKKAVTELLQ